MIELFSCAVASAGKPSTGVQSVTNKASATFAYGRLCGSAACHVSTACLGDGSGCAALVATGRREEGAAAVKTGDAGSNAFQAFVLMLCRH